MKPCSYELLPVDEIKLDRRNPRIAKWLEMYGQGEVPDEQISLALGVGSSTEEQTGPSYLSLRQSILTNHGIIHPIIVNKETNGELVVIEGNTRTKIYREFKEQNIPGNWDEIPAMVHDSLSAAEIDAIRLQAHLVGTREWDPYSKAKYLDYLRNGENLTFSQLVDFCGGKKTDVQNLIDAYRDMEKYYRRVLDSDQDFDHTRFSAFLELQKIPRIREELLKHKFTLDDFAHWVHEKKLYPQKYVRQLVEILKNDKSREIFLRDGAEQAWKVVNVPSQETTFKDITLEQLARELGKRIGKIEYSYIKKLRTDAEFNEKEIFFYTRDALIELCNDIESEES